MGQPLNVGGIVQDAARRLQAQREAARQVSQDIAAERATTAATQAPSPPGGQG